MTDESSRAARQHSPAQGDLTRTDAGSGPSAEGVGGQLRPGDVVDRYEIIELCGSGGMGIVYRARDIDLGRDVALKLLQTGERDEAVQRRFLREAQAMARIAHPNLVTVYDVGTFRSRVFLAMEFVHGSTLSEWLGAEPRAVEEVLAVFAQAGAGLAAAHEAGLVHRDFKPDNVMVGDDGRVRVADFGLARSILEVGTPDEDVATDRVAEGADMLATPLTRTGAVMGTPAYMAPEQHRGRPIDARADQFAFAVALYEALYGVRPFPGDTHAEILASVLAGTPRPPPEDKRVSPAVMAVLSRALRTEPNDRYPAIPALLAALEGAAAPKRFSARRSLLLLAAAVLLLGTAGAGAFALWPERREPPPAAADHLDLGDLADLAIEGKLDEVAIRRRVLEELSERLSERPILERLATPPIPPIPPPHDRRDAGAESRSAPAEPE